MRYSLELFSKYNIYFDWNTVFVGWQFKFFTHRDVTQFATKFLSEHPDNNNKFIVDLAWGNESLTEELLTQIINYDSKKTEKELTNIAAEETQKWVYCILNNLIEFMDNKEELLKKVAELYSMFNYPSDMEKFIYYMPQSEDKPDEYKKEYTKDENYSQLLSYLKEFLIQERRKLMPINDTKN